MKVTPKQPDGKGRRAKQELDLWWGHWADLRHSHSLPVQDEDLGWLTPEWDLNDSAVLPSGLQPWGPKAEVGQVLAMAE